MGEKKKKTTLKMNKHGIWEALGIKIEFVKGLGKALKSCWVDVWDYNILLPCAYSHSFYIFLAGYG
jgi:hypothetical protein